MTNDPPNPPASTAPSNEVSQRLPDHNSAHAFTVTDAWCLTIGLALGIGFGTLIHNDAVGIGTGVAIGVAANLARRKGSPSWTRWLGLYAALVVIADLLRMAGVLK